MRASVGWKWKAGDGLPQIGCSTCKSSLQEAISVHLHLPTTKFGGMWLFQIVLEQAKEVVGRAALGTLVHKIERFAVDRQDANAPPLNHPVEIAGPRLHGLFGRDGELLPRRRLG